ncbi:MAG: hypothetical protein IT424_11950 [Pirellulales bacterium]|nr:hypothetical protein [Pirellulales bacterium]
MLALLLPLLADFADVLQGLMPIIFVILYGIAHLVGALQQEKRKGRPKPRPRPPQAEAAAGKGAVAPPGNRDTLEDSLRREVEEFLRRAQGQPPQSPAKSRQPQSPPRAASRPPTVRPRPLQPPRQPERAADPAPPRRLVESVRTESIAAPLEPLRTTLGAPPTDAGSARHVGDPLRTQSVALHSQTLGAEVAQADERMAEHVRQVFVHQVGTLGRRNAAGNQPGGQTQAAREIRDLLTQPGGVRQLVIANEILRRPDERWQH